MNAVPGLEVARDDVLDPAALIDHPSGFLALSARNARFREPRGGFVAYREHGKHLIAFGGVHAPAAARAELLDRFLAHAGRGGWRLVFVQVRESQVPLFRSRGFTVNQFGTTFTLTL